MRLARFARCVVTLLAFVVPAEPHAKQPLGAARFTQHFATKLRAAAPDLTVTVLRELELRAVAKDKREGSVFLDNAYADYTRAPEELDAIVARHVASTRDALREVEAKIERSRIVPVIKDRAWLEETRRALRERGARDTARVAQVWEEYNSELLVFYVEDSPTNMRFLTEEDLRAAGVSRKELRKLGVRNLLSILPNIELRGQEGLFMITAGGDYEASLLLADTIWESGQVKVNGDVVVAVPARDLLLVCGSRDVEAIAKLREIAAKAASESSYRLTPRLFVRRKGRFQPL